MKTELEVDDIIYEMYHGKILGTRVIARVTKTMAITKMGRRFRRKIDPLGIHLVTRDSCYRYDYQLETPELQVLHQLQTKRNKSCIALNDLAAGVYQLNSTQLEVIDNMLTKCKKEIE